MNGVRRSGWDSSTGDDEVDERERPADPPTGRFSGLIGPRWPDIVQLVCFAWVVWLPVWLNFILYPALAVITGTSLLIIVRDRIRLTRRGSGVLIGYLAFLAIWMCYGYAIGNPGATHQLLVWLGSAVIWLPWSLTLRGNHVRRTGWIIAVVGIIASVTIIFLAFCGLYGWQVPRFLAVTQLARSALSGSGELAIAYAGIPVLIPICGFVIVAACSPRSRFLPPRWLLVVSSVLVCVAGITCARRGVALTVALVVGIVILATLVRAVRRRDDLAGMFRRGGFVAPLLLLTTVATAMTIFGRPLRRLAGSAVDLVRVLLSSSAESRVSAGKPPTSGAVPTVPSGAVPVVPGTASPIPALNVDDTIRYDQVAPVLRQWERSPWFGHGFGAVRDGAPPGISRPWRMELQPLQVLMNVGILGCIVLASILVMAALEVRRAYLRSRENRGLLLSFGAASLVLLVADCLNPLLQAVGQVWGVIAVLGIAQCVLTGDTALSTSGAESDDRTAERIHLPAEQTAGERDPQP